MNQFYRFAELCEKFKKIADKNQYVYHIKSKEFVGKTIYSLNQIKNIDPKIYKKSIAKYKNRMDHITTKIDLLDCTWADVVNLSTLNPIKIFELASILGNKNYKYNDGVEIWQIPISNLKNTEFCYYDDNVSDKSKKAYKKIKLDNYKELDFVPTETVKYFVECVESNEDPLIFASVPHLLVKDKVSLANAKKLTFRPLKTAKVYSYFEKKADIPSWMPEDIKNHPDILYTANKIEKEMGVDDFREKVNINIGDTSENEENIQNISEDMFNQFEKAIDALSDDIKVDFLQQIIDIGLENFQKYLSVNIFEKTIVSEDKKIKIQSGQKVTSVYNFVKNLVTDDIKIKNLEDLNGFKKFTTKKDKEFFVVFSTNPVDLLTMSARSEWSTCQNIFDNSNIMRGSAIGSAVSKHIGIIYLTNEKDFYGKGEEMLFRSLVRLIVDEDGSNALFVDELKPDENETVSNIFKTCLRKHTKTPVFSNYFSPGFSLPKSENDEEYEPIETSYHDSNYTRALDLDDFEIIEKLERYSRKNRNIILDSVDASYWFLLKLFRELNDSNIDLIYDFKDLIREIYKKHSNDKRIQELISNEFLEDYLRDIMQNVIYEM